MVIVGENLNKIYENITENNIVVQSVKAALDEENDLNLAGAIKQYINLDDRTDKILDDEKLKKEINGETNLDAEGVKQSLRNVGEVYNEKGEGLGKIEFSIADGIGIKGITMVNLSNLDIANPNEIA